MSTWHTPAILIDAGTHVEVQLYLIVFFDTFSTVTAADIQSFSDRSELLPPLEIALLLVIW